MAATDPPPEPEQEQIIKAKKQQLFEADLPAVTGPRKPFAEYVRATPAAPLAGWVKALLWGAGAVVVLILLYALVRGPRPRARPAARADGSTPASIRLA